MQVCSRPSWGGLSISRLTSTTMSRNDSNRTIWPPIRNVSPRLRAAARVSSISPQGLTVAGARNPHLEGIGILDGADIYPDEARGAWVAQGIAASGAEIEAGVEPGPREGDVGACTRDIGIERVDIEWPAAGTDEDVLTQEVQRAEAARFTVKADLALPGGRRHIRPPRTGWRAPATPWTGVL